MQRSRLGAIALGTSALLGAALASPALAATETGTTVPTFQEFHASTFKDADNQYIVDGDVPVATTGDLKSFYDELVATDTPTNGLIVNKIGSVDDKWNDTQKLNLTYCICNNFGANKAAVVAAFNSGHRRLGGARQREVRLPSRRRTAAAPREQQRRVQRPSGLRPAVPGARVLPEQRPRLARGPHRHQLVRQHSAGR